MNDESGVAEMIRERVNAAVMAERERCAAKVRALRALADAQFQKYRAEGDAERVHVCVVAHTYLTMAYHGIENGDAP